MVVRNGGEQMVYLLTERHDRDQQPDGVPVDRHAGSDQPDGVPVDSDIQGVVNLVVYLLTVTYGEWSTWWCTC